MTSASGPLTCAGVQCDLLFVGNRLPDRERRVEEFFLRAADLAPEFRFFLGGEGWGGKSLPKNVRWIGHVGTGDHNRLNCSARMVLNINRDSMAGVGFSPPTRMFEAAGAGSLLKRAPPRRLVFRRRYRFEVDPDVTLMHLPSDGTPF